MGKEWDRLLKAPSGSAHARQHSVSFVNPGNPTCRNCGGLKSLESEGSGGRTKCRCDDPDFPNHLLPRARAMQEWHQAWATEALRVLKPGGHLLAFGGTRTYHRLVCAVEDAGFEIRDTISWLYGSGFPKSLDVSKAIDRAGGGSVDLRAVAEHIRERRKATDVSVTEMASWFPYAEVTKNWERTDPGQRVPSQADYAVLVERIAADPDLEVRRAAAERAVVGHVEGGHGWGRDGSSGHRDEFDLTAPATPEAERWEGWGTALKPAHEPVVVARKPLSGTVAGNVLEHSTGALNISGCRVGHASEADLAESQAKNPGRDDLVSSDVYGAGRPQQSVNVDGRWPANVVLDGEAARLLDEQTGESSSTQGHRDPNGSMGYHGGASGTPFRLDGYADQGGASRFFYVAKASRGERGAGLDAVGCTCETFTEWVNEDQSQSTPAGSDTPPPRDTTAPTSTDGSDTSTTGSGNRPTDPSPKGSPSTTSTETSRTTGSITSNLSTPGPTSGSTPPTTESSWTDGNDAATSAASGSPPTPSTTTSAPKAGPSTDAADPATSRSSSQPNSGARCASCGGVVQGALRNSHPT